MQWFAGSGLKSKDPSQRAEAVASLAGVQTPASVRSALAALGDPSADVREAALNVLLHWRDENTVRALLHLLRDPAPELRVRAINELGKLAARNTLANVLPSLCDPIATVRSAAADTLALFGWVPETPAERALDFVGRSQFMKAAALGRVALELLLPLAGNPHAATRRSVAEALGAIRDPQSISALEKLLEDADPTVRLTALYAYTALQPKWSSLAKVLNGADANLRAAAVEAIGQMRDNEAVPALLDRLKDTHWEVRCAAAAALALIGESSTLPAVADLLADTDADVRVAAVTALGAFGAVQAIEPLVLAHLDVETRVRQAAAQAVMRVDYRWMRNPLTHRMLPALKKTLRADDYNVRAAAAELMERIFGIRQQRWRPNSADRESDRRAQAAEVLIACLWDDNAFLRGAAAEALGQLRSRRAVDFLKVRLEDEDQWVRAQATTAIASVEQDAPGWTPSGATTVKRP